MKKQSSICSLLGVTQQNMAMLLGVSRSLWSLYELGKRDLPLQATLLLSDMLEHVKHATTTTKPAHFNEKHQTEKQQQLEAMLRENEYQQLLMEKKIAAIQKKQAAQTRLLQLVDFLESRKGKDVTGEKMNARAILNKAVKPVAGNDVAILTAFEIKFETLELEKLVLESKMRKIKITLANTGISKI